MHICATNICVWIRTLVLESLKEITLYHQGRGPNPEDGAILDSIRTHSLRHAGTVMGTNYGPDAEWEPINLNIRENGNGHQQESDSILSRMVHTTARIATGAATTAANLLQSSSTSTSTTTARPTTTTTTSAAPSTESTTLDASLFMTKLKSFVTSTTTTTKLPPHQAIIADESSEEQYSTSRSFVDMFTTLSTSTSTTTQTPSTSTTPESIFNNLFGGMENALQYTGQVLNGTSNAENERTFESLDSLFPAALIGPTVLPGNTSCGRVNIMGTIVQDSAPYLYPFIIEYSLIGAVVIYVMWKHIGRHPK